MSLNIKNERTVALIRELAERTGQTKTAAIEDAVRSRLSQLAEGGPATARKLAARKAAADRLLTELRGSVTAEERAVLRAADAQMYDDLGLPR